MVVGTAIKWNCIDMRRLIVGITTVPVSQINPHKTVVGKCPCQDRRPQNLDSPDRYSISISFISRLVEPRPGFGWQVSRWCDLTVKIESGHATDPQQGRAYRYDDHRVCGNPVTGLELTRRHRRRRHDSGSNESANGKVCDDHQDAPSRELNDECQIPDSQR